MTLAYFIGLASFGAAMNDHSTFEEYDDIHDFAKTWRELADVELEDIELKIRPK